MEEGFVVILHLAMMLIEMHVTDCVIKFSRGNATVGYARDSEGFPRFLGELIAVKLQDFGGRDRGATQGSQGDVRC